MARLINLDYPHFLNYTGCPFSSVVDMGPRALTWDRGRPDMGSRASSPAWHGIACVTHAYW